MANLTRRLTRRRILQTTVAAAVTGWAGGWHHFAAHAYIPNEREVPPGERPPQDPSVEVLHPRARIPLSFIIDDSTCLVNMGAYCMPQFRAVWPQNPAYWKKWQDWPREIPDSFVREFGEFCATNGVRGKYSIVPYPACVGWLDRELPGWTRKDLLESLKLVRELMVPNWDITPEMITHTRVIDLKTGRPTEELSAGTMENSYPPVVKSADEMAAYMAYALRILKNAGLPCEAITTPGGFGNKCKAELSLGVRQAVTDVFAPEIPHYFKYIVDKNESSLPRLEHVEGLNTPNPRLVVNVPATTGDWLGGWEGDVPPQPDKYCNEDATAGRMVETLERGQPTVMFAHWSGFYSNGTKKGFEACKRVILAINSRYRDKTIWMKTSELARYQAARELTTIERTNNKLSLTAPFAGPSFTMRVRNATNVPTIRVEDKPVTMTEVTKLTDLKPGTWIRESQSMVLCIDLPKGKVTVEV